MTKEEKIALKAEKKAQKMIDKAQKPTMKDMFSSNASKAGGFSVASIAIVLVIVILINMIAAKLPEKFTLLDLTANGDFTIGDVTKDILTKLSKEITITYVVQSGSEDVHITSLLNSYEGASSKITIKTADPVVSPSY